MAPESPVDPGHHHTPGLHRDAGHHLSDLSPEGSLPVLCQGCIAGQSRWLVACPPLASLRAVVCTVALGSEARGPSSPAALDAEPGLLAAPLSGLRVQASSSCRRGLSWPVWLWWPEGLCGVHGQPWCVTGDGRWVPVTLCLEQPRPAEGAVAGSEERTASVGRRWPRAVAPLALGCRAWRPRGWCLASGQQGTQDGHPASTESSPEWPLHLPTSAGFPPCWPGLRLLAGGPGAGIRQPPTHPTPVTTLCPLGLLQVLGWLFAWAQSCGGSGGGCAPVMGTWSTHAPRQMALVRHRPVPVYGHPAAPDVPFCPRRAWVHLHSVSASFQASATQRRGSQGRRPTSAPTGRRATLPWRSSTPRRGRTSWAAHRACVSTRCTVAGCVCTARY